jgi:adenylate cyclase
VTRPRCGTLVRPMERTPAAILMLDVAGYTRLMEGFERDTHDRLMALRDSVLNVSLADHGGRVVKRTGDGFVALFEDAKNAVGCAVAIQQATRQREADQAPERRISFRIGVNAGYVMIESEDVYGNDVNIAARLQELAEPGELLISAAAREDLGADRSLPVIDLGPLRLRNMIKPVQAFRIVMEMEADRPRLHPNPLVDQPSIAVLPFRTLDSKVPRYFGQAFVEDIVGALASLREVLVISRASTVSYNRKVVDIRAIGRRLGVKYVLSGSVAKTPGRLQVMAELADTENGLVLWARRYDLKYEDLYEIQDQITGLIVNTIAPQVRQAEIKRAYQKRPEIRSAYDYFLQAVDLIYRFEPDEFAQAGAMIRRAIALDDSYAAAYALAAEWHSLRVGQGWSPDPDADSREAIRLAEAAVARDAANALALALLGHHRSYLFRDYDVAVALFDRALEASPSNARVWGLSAPTYTYMGDPAAAFARAERALRLSPQDPMSFWYRTAICIAQYSMGDYEKAIETGRIALAENSRYTTVPRTIAAALAALGRLQEARAEGRAMLALEPTFRAGAYIARHPYRDPSQRERLYHHLIAAGLPE